MQTKKLIKYRKAAKLSQSDVAKKLDCTASAVNQYEKGKRQPSVDVLVKLAKIYGCTINDLV